MSTQSELIVSIPKDDFPSKNQSLEFKYPLYKDLRKARQSYPAGNDSPGYSVEELLLAQLMVGVDGREFSKIPTNPIEKIYQLSIEDRQYAMLSFLSGFFTDPEVSAKARQMAKDLRAATPSNAYSVEASDSPSGTLSVTFNRPNTGSQIEANKRWTSLETNGCTFEEYLVAICLADLNASKVVHPKDVPSVMDELEIVDVQFLAILFVNLFLLDDSGVEDAKAKGKSYKASATSKKPVVSTKKATAEPLT